MFSNQDTPGAPKVVSALGPTQHQQDPLPIIGKASDLDTAISIILKRTSLPLAIIRVISRHACGDIYVADKQRIVHAYVAGTQLSSHVALTQLLAQSEAQFEVLIPRHRQVAADNIATLNIRLDLLRLSSNKFLSRGLLAAELVPDNRKLVNPIQRRARPIKGRDPRPFVTHGLMFAAESEKPSSSLDVLCCTLAIPFLLLLGGACIVQQMNKPANHATRFAYNLAASSPQISSAPPTAHEHPSLPVTSKPLNTNLPSYRSGQASLPNSHATMINPMSLMSSPNFQPSAQTADTDVLAGSQTTLEIIQLATTLIQNNKLQEAADLYVKALTKYPDDGQLRIEAVKALISIHDYTRAKLICASSLHPMHDESQCRALADLQSGIPH